MICKFQLNINIICVNINFTYLILPWSFIFLEYAKLWWWIQTMKCINDAILISHSLYIVFKSTLRFIKLWKMKSGVFVKKKMLNLRLNTCEGVFEKIGKKNKFQTSDCMHIWLISRKLYLKAMVFVFFKWNYLII